MEWVKLVHVCCAVLTGLSFFVRGIWHFQNNALAGHKLSKIVPHCIDSLLLISGITMAVYYQFNLLHQPWLLIKLVLLVVYIALGMSAFRFCKTMRYRVASWILALLVLFTIYYVAMTKTTVLQII